jgi:hypothetical protein
MPVSEEEMIVRTEGYYISENVLNPRATPAEMAEFLRSGKHTGQLNTQTNQGGVLGAVFVQKRKLTMHEDDKVRKALGMADDDE